MGALLDAAKVVGKVMLEALQRPDNLTARVKPRPAVPLHCPPEEWRERDINRWLKEEFFSRHKANGAGGWLRFVRYISVEFEEHNHLRLVVMTKAFMRINIDAELTDLWHDQRTSSLTLTVKSITLLGLPILPQFLSRWLTHLCMSIAGFLFNPILFSNGIFVRFSAGIIRLDLHRYFRECDHAVVSRYFHDTAGKLTCSFVIYGATTYRGGITAKIHELSPPAKDRFAYRTNNPTQSDTRKWFRLEDIWQLSLVAAVAFVMVLLVRQYVFPEIPEISVSWSFLTSLLALLISMGIINLARWVYQFYCQAKRKPIIFRAEEIRYRIDRIKRDIELEMHLFRKETNAEQLEDDLFRAGLHRQKVITLAERIEVFGRELKIKYALAYIITIISEYIAFRYF